MNNKNFLEENAALILNQIFNTDDEASNATNAVIKEAEERKKSIEAEKERLKNKLMNDAKKEIEAATEKSKTELLLKKEEAQKNMELSQNKIEETFNLNRQKYIDELFLQIIS